MVRYLLSDIKWTLQFHYSVLVTSSVLNDAVKAVATVRVPAPLWRVVTRAE